MTLSDCQIEALMYFYPMLDSEYQTPDLSLRVTIDEDNQTIKLSFYGKSKAQSPSDFLNPILQEICSRAIKGNKNIILDFYHLEFMNSATVSPIIKLWAQLKTLGISLTVEFNSELMWQKANFMAFSIFEKESKLFNLRAR